MKTGMFGFTLQKKDETLNEALNRLEHIRQKIKKR